MPSRSEVHAPRERFEALEQWNQGQARDQALRRNLADLKATFRWFELRMALLLMGGFGAVAGVIIERT